MMEDAVQIEHELNQKYYSQTKPSGEEYETLKEQYYQDEINQ